MAQTPVPSIFSTVATASSLATEISDLSLSRGDDNNNNNDDNNGQDVQIVDAGGSDHAFVRYGLPQALPLWLNQSVSRHMVKGNFLTLSRLPITVEPGEWMAHQIVEHYMNLCHFMRVVCEKEDDGTSICNAETCPTMSGGPRHTYTWMTADRMAVAVPAREYMSLMQRWVTRLLDDETLFPTDSDGVAAAAWPGRPSTEGGNDDWLGRRGGFPREFYAACRNIARQIARVYTHLYWTHFVTPFYELSLDKALNSCFCHFVLSTTAPIRSGIEGTVYPPLLWPNDPDLAPLLPLLDLWAANGMCPPQSEVYRFADRQAGRHLLQMGGVGA